MKNVGFVLLIIVTIVILIKANKAKQFKESYNHPKPLTSYSDEYTLHNAANPATAVGAAFTEEQKRQLASQSNLDRDEVVRNYIDRFKQTARKEAELYNIPVSIKLAQGIIESNAGQSKLARKQHNHFGIKCTKTCSTCECAIYADDSPRDRFRIFQSAWFSYREHSLLLTGSRYKHLLKISHKDYKSWAYGLQKAGYATNPNYAKLLISVIEKYQLHKI